MKDYVCNAKQRINNSFVNNLFSRHPAGMRNQEPTFASGHEKNVQRNSSTTLQANTTSDQEMIDYEMTDRLVPSATEYVQLAEPHIYNIYVDIELTIVTEAIQSGNIRVQITELTIDNRKTILTITNNPNRRVQASLRKSRIRGVLTTRKLYLNSKPKTKLCRTRTTPLNNRGKIIKKSFPR